MNFNKHYTLEGKHAYLSASNYHWVNYDEDKFMRTYSTFLATLQGTEMHELACKLISMGVKLPDEPKTINMYVNDAIGFKMTPEQIVYYSANAFGTADAISFRGNLLRIHDLKTGVSKVSMLQPKIYAALFCLEYDVNPMDIEIKLRIYQSNDIQKEVAEPDEIFHIMDKIVSFDRKIEEMRMEGYE